ncbi:MAG: class II fructose-bisphosphate aldolase [Patescibacteria group bacterium]|nr:class II fructose-bisphosphate aldolase [Patescibacteria group bacterium]MDE2438552.1 class II fructose-bisphosphate aldolase [Patescibacteria group bacterium]
MKTLYDYLEEARATKTAIAHFNISDFAALGAIMDGAKKVSREAGNAIPIIIGVSEGERAFIGVRQVAALIASIREQEPYPVFLNADHTHTLRGVEDAVRAGYDAVIFDGAQYVLEENIKKTKEAADAARAIRSDVIIEGELGYIGTSSEVLHVIPEGASQGDYLTTVPDAERFVAETGVNLFAPAVGNLHGILKDVPEPHLDIARIEALHASLNTPLVLHGGSGTRDEEFIAAIRAGISIVHISTELRVAWRAGIEETLATHPEEVAPYKLLLNAREDMGLIVEKRLKLFQHLV